MERIKSIYFIYLHAINQGLAKLLYIQSQFLH